MFRDVATGLSRDAYFEAGFEVLSDVGYAGLKLAEVCGRLGVTSGSFYHYFSNWSAYTHGQVNHWKQHRTEAAIRTWSNLDPDVHAAQAAVDQARHDVMRKSALEILGDERQARVFADWAVYLLIGYEQCSLPRDKVTLEWIAGQLLDALDSGRFATFPEQPTIPEQH